jgi:YVTN family beta-propeller protein
MKNIFLTKKFFVAIVFLLCFFASTEHVFADINIGSGQKYVTLVGNKIYTSNNDNTISVINTTNDSVIKTIGSVSSGYMTSVGNKLYVAGTAGNVITVINTLTDTVSSTINVSNSPFYISVWGTKLYVNHYDGTNNPHIITVINTNTDAITTTITGLNQLYYTYSLGDKVYVSNSGSNSISIIDAINDTISTIIGSVQSPVSFKSIGTKLFIGNGTLTNTSVLDTVNNSISNISEPGVSTAGSLCGMGTKIYKMNLGNSMSVIDAINNTVSSNITVGNSPSQCIVLNSKVYVINASSNTVSVIDTNTDTVVDTISVGSSPQSLVALGNKIYVESLSSAFVSVIDTTTIPSQLPNLTSFSTNTPSGPYDTGDSITITANFGTTVQAGSTMTVLLNSGTSVVLNNVSGSTLSGTYTVQAGDATPDLAIRSITSASVSDGTHTRTSYSLPSSQGSFTAENSFITRNLGDTKNINIGSYEKINVGSNPYQISTAINGYLYVANQGAGTVSVINQATGALTQTITVGSEPYGLASVGTQLYVANTGSDTVSVIDTTTNTVTTSISVGVKPYYVAVIGTNVYVTNGASNTVSVINSATNTVTATIPVGSYPRGIKAYGTDLYVANYGDPNYSGGNYISVINSLTNTVSNYIITPAGSDGPRGVTALGSNVYVTNFRSNNVSVINTTTKAITATIPVGTGPRGITGLGSKLYVENFDDGTISIIDTNSNTVTSTVDVGHSPAGMSIVGTDIYISLFQDDALRILDTTTGLLKEDSKPISKTLPSVSFEGNTATLSGEIIAIGNSNVITRGFEYGTTTSYGTTTIESGSFSAGTFSADAEGLISGTTYHFRSYATSSLGTGYGNDMTFVSSASTYTLVGPSSGLKDTESEVFTVTPNGNFIGNVTITPSGGGLTNPINLAFSSADPQTFTITPTLSGTVTLTATNDGGLTDPGEVEYVVLNTYWFTSYNNQSPNDLSNYWTNEGLNEQATSLPLPTDVLNIAQDSIYGGTAKLNGSAKNSGIISGNAIFNGDYSENLGTIIGNKIRRYLSNTTTTRNNTKWIVVADGAVVDITNSAYDSQSTFFRMNGGSFTPSQIYHFYVNDGSISSPSSYTVDGDHSSEILPTFNLDEIYVDANIRFNGNIVFNGSSQNNGIVIGNAIFKDNSVNNSIVNGDSIFYGDYSENLGTISGDKIRRYLFDTTTTKDFDGWTVVADGAVVNVEGAIIGSATLTTENFGSFVYAHPLSAVLSNSNLLTITYSQILDPGSIPSTNDYQILVNGSTSIGIDNINIDGDKVLITINGSVNENDVVKLTYIIGESPVRVDADKNTGNLINYTVVNSIISSASTYTLVGPSSGLKDTESEVFTVTPNGNFIGNVTITPSGGGLTNPINLAFSSADPQTFTITPTLSGTVTLTATNDGGLTDPGEVEYVVNYIDTTAPTLTEVTPVSTPSTTTTPTYTFSSSEAGSISYGGACTSSTTSATTGNNTITLATLTPGTYTNCTITVTDSSLNASTPLTITTFTITQPSSGGGGGGSSGGSIPRTPDPIACPTGVMLDLLTGKRCTVFTTPPLTTINPNTPDRLASIFDRNLKLKMKGSDVKALQQYLNTTLNLPKPLIIDGIFGKYTLNALKIFQKDNNLIPDGIFGPKTKEVMNKILAAK